jgi:betaine reductase
VAVYGASLTLQHVPDLVRYGSKPWRELERADELAAHLRSFGAAVSYPPNQVFVGNLDPQDLWDRPRPWSQSRSPMPHRAARTARSSTSAPSTSC